jgi:multiple sugar transport system ATP-binding protein
VGRRRGALAEIALQKVTKVFRDGTKAVSSLDLEVADGELMVLVGPSGCGKTTALRMVAGLEDITEGTIRIGDRVVNDRSPGERDVAMVFQNYALYPHMTVYQNMALSLRIKKVARREIEQRVREAARILHLEDLLHRRPKELSGGQRQRVAMGRAIVRQPQAFLMDEPLSNLDAKLRVQMRAEILRIQQHLGVTTIYVTHDQTEAMTLGTRVAVLNNGVLQQVAAPQHLYRHPGNLFVAGFIGSPAMNFVEAGVIRANGDLFVEFGPHRLRIPPDARASKGALGGYVGRKIVIGIRPEDLDDAAVVTGSRPDSRLPAVVDLREDMGSEVLLHFGIEAPPVLTEDTQELASDLGSEALQELHEQASEGRTTFIAKAGPETGAAVGQRVEIYVDTRKLHFFDPATGQAIYGERIAPLSSVAASRAR